jgi:hypothetical protein
MKWNIPGRFRSLLFLAAKEDGTRAGAVGDLQTTRAAAEWSGDLGTGLSRLPTLALRCASSEICATARARTQGQ